MNNGQKCGILIGAVLIILMSLFGLSILWNKGSILAEERYAYDREGTQKSVFASNGEVAYLCCCKEEKFYLYYVDKMGFRKLPYFCGGNERIIRMDEEVLKKFDISNEYNSLELFKKIDEIFDTKESVSKICFNCMWREKCLFYQKLSNNR